MACVLYQGRDVPKHSQGIFDASWVDKLYRGVARHSTVPFRFVCFTDQDYDFEEFIEVRSLVLPCRNMFSLLEPFREDLGRVTFMGLDTVIVGNIDPILHHDGPFSMIRDPNSPKIGCSGVMSYPYCPHIWDDVVLNLARRQREYQMCDVPSDMIYLNRWNPAYLDDVISGVYSYKVHIRRDRSLLEKARIVYFHGRDKPHEIDDEFVREYWV